VDPSIRNVSSVQCNGAGRRKGTDPLVVEEPLEIRLAGKALCVTMRTPGRDIALAAGFLFTEGILSSPAQVGTIAHCTDPDEPQRHNVIDVLPAPDAPSPREGWQRAFHATSSCGICGTASIEALRRSAPPLSDESVFSAERIYALPDRLRPVQPIFEKTGALHAAALFGAQGDLELLCEDVGRHNAVDKVIGEQFLAGTIPLRGRILLVSGRASFEITQKAFVAGIPAVAAISGVSTLAVDLAREAGMLLVGFLRGRTMQVYAGTRRLAD
jgi:FdhD protein